MARNTAALRSHYVLNVTSRQLHRDDSRTDLFFHVSLSPRREPAMALLMGYVTRDSLLSNDVGAFFAEGSRRVRADGSSFPFGSDTYEIRMDEFTSPPAPLAPNAQTRTLR